MLKEQEVVSVFTLLCGKSKVGVWSAVPFYGAKSLLLDSEVEIKQARMQSDWGWLKRK